MDTNPPTRLFPVGEASRPGTYNPWPPSRAAAPGATQPTLIQVSHRLRPRDYTIALLLQEHTTLTTGQLAAAVFASEITCRHRLGVLRSFGFVDRFIRHHKVGISTTVCWVPGLLSARWCALAGEHTPPAARALRERQDRIYANPALEHLLETNGFFIRLLSHSREHPGASLLRWWSERTATAAYGRRIRPDGHGVWAEQGREVGFFLELDRGTETLGQVADKLAAYRRLRNEGGPPYPVLFALPNRTREQNLHARLADRPGLGVTMATTSPEAGEDPAGPVWRLFGNGRHRIPLADLPGGHGLPGPLNPGQPTPDQLPLS